MGKQPASLDLVVAQYLRKRGLSKSLEAFSAETHFKDRKNVDENLVEIYDSYLKTQPSSESEEDNDSDVESEEGAEDGGSTEEANVSDPDAANGADEEFKKKSKGKKDEPEPVVEDKPIASKKQDNGKPNETKYSKKKKGSKDEAEQVSGAEVDSDDMKQGVSEENVDEKSEDDVEMQDVEEEKEKKKENESSKDMEVDENKGKTGDAASDEKEKASKDKKKKGKKGVPEATEAPEAGKKQEADAEVQAVEGTAKQGSSKKRKRNKGSVEGQKVEEVEAATEVKAAPTDGVQATELSNSERKNKKKKKKAEVALEPEKTEEKVEAAPELKVEEAPAKVEAVEEAKAAEAPGGQASTSKRKKKKKGADAATPAKDTDAAPAVVATLASAPVADEKAVEKPSKKKNAKKGETVPVMKAETDSGKQPVEGDKTVQGEVKEKEGEVKEGEVKESKSAKKKRKKKNAEAEGAEGAEGEKQNGGRPFQRVNPEQVEIENPLLRDNSYWAKDGAEGGYGAMAQEKLGQVRGRNFRHEKTKKKRGTYKGGVIDTSSHSIKFDTDSD